MCVCVCTSVHRVGGGVASCGHIPVLIGHILMHISHIPVDTCNGD